MLRVLLLEEPELFFGGNKTCPDPQVGLLNYGPHGGGGIDPKERITIRAGVIGTDRSIEATRRWLNRLKYRISAKERFKTEYKGVDFPGLSPDGPLRFEISIDENCVLRIERKFVTGLKAMKRKQRILSVVNVYCRKFDDMLEAHPRPDIILLPIDDSLLRLCKEPHRKMDKIVYQRRDFGDPESATAPLFDFHNYIKAQAALRELPTQMITPKTLIFSEEKQSPALIGWNISVAVYYKGTSIPWKLAEIDDETCYIGVSFYNEGKSMRASIAQVYMRTGESQVIRGERFEWEEEQRGRKVHLDSEQMAKLISDAVNVFVRQRGKQPRRMVIHKSTSFTEEEILGCEEGSSNSDELDVIHIPTWSSFRAYHKGYDYPAVRGMAIAGSREAMLFTSGYVPVLATYPGPSVPSPLHVICQRLDTSIDLVCRDLLGLTKLDWNTCTFYTRMPVTISVSTKVGAVMAEMVKDGRTPPKSYRFYM